MNVEACVTLMLSILKKHRAFRHLVVVRSSDTALPSKEAIAVETDTPSFVQDPIRLFNHYLSIKMQYYKVQQDETSDHLSINCSVPQKTWPSVVQILCIKEDLKRSTLHIGKKFNHLCTLPIFVA